MPATIARLFDQIVPSNKDLLRVCRIFQHELDQALQFQAPDSLQVYPTFVHRLPNGSERGKYLALDLGGTNFRILLITLTGKHESQVSNKVFAISQELMHGPGGELFEYIAKCLHDFCLEADIIDERLPLGFTFSFPCKQAGLRKAYLTSWTKGFKCADTVNHDVCDMLQSALDKYPRLKIDVAAILNDTTGTLTSCAYMDSRCRVGVIIGECSLRLVLLFANCFPPRHWIQPLLHGIEPRHAQRWLSHDHQHRTGRVGQSQRLPRPCPHQVG